MRATRRTFRTAAIATGAIAALAVPTTAAFAADTPPNPSNPSNPSNPQGQVDETGQDKSKATDDTNGTDHTDDTNTDTETPKPGSWESKGTTDLGKGWSAKVDVNVSARTAKASLSLDGTAKGSLTAYEKPASTTIDGSTFTLTPDGTITRTGGKPTPPKPQPKPTPDHKRTLVHQYANLGGSGFDAKVYKVKGGYEADMIAKAPDTGKKIVWDTLKQSGSKPAYGQHNGAHFVLNPDGTMKGWTEGKSGNSQKPRNGTSQVVPKGGVKAGAEGVSPVGESTPLVAAGGGMAALGAAGLGFAVYRRKQNN
ncbi:hypothetical protein GCM10010449_57120 [Streptomyces rectiviolaceus]|uniref:Gram-positive cocci surface proteins LPxTG domain-containing protein n=1 Tax=Streptomyces rectiviolaceus TaxID=332591 RepID=A0ABP6MWD1_9ACTN